MNFLRNRGQTKSPILLELQKMIEVNFITSCLKEELEKRNLFLVEVVVRPVNKIAVYIDSMQGVKLEECIAVSRYLESMLNRDTEDFELEVSSPGLDKPLKLPVQYKKNIGRFLDVVLFTGIKVTGKLNSIEEGIVTIEKETPGKDKITGKRITEITKQEIKLEEIKAAKVVLSLNSKNKHGKP